MCDRTGIVCLKDTYQQLEARVILARDLWAKIESQIPTRDNVNALMLNTVFQQVLDEAKTVHSRIQSVDMALTAQVECVDSLNRKFFAVSEELEEAKEELAAAKEELRAKAKKVADLNQKLTAKGNKSSALLFPGASDPRFSACRTPAGAPSLLRPGEETEWTVERQESLANSLRLKIAELSLQPLGLETEDLQEKSYKLAETMRRESYAACAEEKITRAMSLIVTSESKKIKRKKIRAFLRKKNMTDELIDKCFSDYDSGMWQGFDPADERASSLSLNETSSPTSDSESSGCTNETNERSYDAASLYDTTSI